LTLRTDTLPNGLRIVTERMEGLGSASLGMWIAAGCRHETVAQNGIAHFLEHMAFKGTERRTAAAIAEEIENVGGYLNAYTSRETTAYYARVLGEDVPLALDIIADILRAPRFETREIAVERGVILQEIGQALDTPDDIIFDWLQEAAYPDQPMGRPILGLAERVAGFGDADLRGFVAGHYAPNRMILSAAGDVDHDAILRLAEALFGDMPRGAPDTSDPARFVGGERRETRKLEQAHLALAFEAPGHGAPEVYAAQVFATALGGGMSSRLFQEIREKRGLCYTIFAQASAYQDTGSLTIYAGTGGETLGELGGLIVDQLRAATDGLTEAEIARARAQMKAGMVMGLESPSNRAERHARCIEIWGRVPDLEETVAKIEAVDVAAAREVGEKMIAAARPALALYGPVDGAPSLDAISARLAA
jgi:predicted Zn-dependent peptidase